MAISYLFPKGTEQFSITFGPVSMYCLDFCFLMLLLCYLLSFFEQIKYQNVAVGKNKYHTLLWLFFLFYVFITIKFLIQNPIGIATLRTWLMFSSGYLFIIYFPISVKTLRSLKQIVFTGICFVIYIFMLHIYSYIKFGYKLHILSGTFIPILGALFFILSVENKLFGVKPLYSYFIKILILITYFMCGHRSGIIALFFGYIILIFMQRKIFIVQQIALIGFILFAVVIAMYFISPSLTSKLTERLMTTLDSKQETYQGRFYNVARVITFSKEHPLIGLPLIEGGWTRFQYKVSEDHRGHSSSKTCRGIVPHNFLLEWIYYYGYLGLLIGLMILAICFKSIITFLLKYRDDSVYYQIGLGIFAGWVHNIIYLMCNASVSSVYNVFFLFFPVLMLAPLEKNLMRGYIK